MPHDWSALVSDLDLEAGASQDLVDATQRALGGALPEDYLDFMRFSDGAEGRVGDGYLQLWPLEELADLNAGYGVGEFAPGLVLIGSTGGGEAYAVDPIDGGPSRYVQVPFVGMARDLAIPLGDTFAEFLRTVALDPLGSEDPSPDASGPGTTPG